MSQESELLNNIIYHHNQHPERTGQSSELVEGIEKVMKCSHKDAAQLATTHCNSVVTYAVLYAMGKISMTYVDWFQWGLDNKAINKFGFLDWELEDILKALCPGTIIIDHLHPFATGKDKIYKMKIVNAYGTHFMGAYTVNGIWYLADPNDRGVGVTWDALKKGDVVEKVKEFI